jgi:large subunit ribosomal protein L35
MCELGSCNRWVKKEDMPKQKTKKAAAKRFTFTATGKVKFKRTNKRHNMGNKSAKRKLKLRAGGFVFSGDVQHIEECLPYGGR